MNHKPLAKIALTAVIATPLLGAGMETHADTVCTILGASTASNHQESGVVTAQMHRARKLASQMQTLGSLEGIDLTVWNYAVSGASPEGYWDQLQKAQTELVWSEVDCVVIDMVGETYLQPESTITVLDRLIGTISDKQIYVLAYPERIRDEVWFQWPLDSQLSLLNASLFNGHFQHDARIRFVTGVWDNFTPLPDDYHPDNGSSMRAALRVVDAILRDARLAPPEDMP